MKKIFGLVLIIFALFAVKPVLAAGPLLKFVPSTGTYKNGDTFTVKIGVDSGTEKTMAIDVWATFDAEKLEVVSIVKSSTLTDDFGMTTDAANISNADGKFTLSFYTSGGSAAFEAKTVSGDLATITFKVKSTGTAKVNFTCSAAPTDSNIFNMASEDVINCASNINGVYTINENGGGGSTPDPTATPVPRNDDGGNDDTTLPQTGGVGTTIGLLVFGIVGILSSLALRWL